MSYNNRVVGIANNSMSNIRNAGYINKSGNYIYFTDENNNYFLSCYNIETNELTEKISYTCAYDINVIGDWIYYNSGSPGKVFKLKQGKKYPSIVNFKDFYRTIVTNNYIYGIETIEGDTEGKNTCIYRMDLNGKGLTKIVKHSTKYFDVKDDIIYFSNPEDGYALYSCNSEGENLKKLSSTPTSFISIYDQYIYFGNIEYKKIYRIDLNGENEKELYDNDVRDINISPYGIVFNGGNNLYISDLDCKNIEILSKGIFADINIFESNIIYREVVDDKYNKAGFYMMNLKEKKEYNFSVDKLLLYRK